MLIRFDPFRPFDALNEQLQQGRSSRVIPMDAYRAGDQFKVHFDIPGVNPDSIEITIEKNVLSVKAERHWSDEGVETVVCERPQGSFTRDLFLGDNLDTERIQASYDNGVLTLSIPVADKAKARTIEVKGSATSSGTGSSAS
ncbi:MAG: Hsp20/alpha crystallin family protein [Actinobacteria bacterium]|nr:Hsp20/alpha crystallin family protein [Actinomycetota bacterium]